MVSPVVGLAMFEVTGADDHMNQGNGSHIVPALIP